MNLKPILPSLLLAATTIQADVVSAAFTAGAAVTSNGSVISLGQPLVGRLQSGGVSLELGILARVSPCIPPCDPRPPSQILEVGGEVVGEILFPEGIVRFDISKAPVSGTSYQLEISGDLTHWQALGPGEVEFPIPNEGSLFARVLLVP